jgi:hypothetical protein
MICRGVDERSLESAIRPILKHLLIFSTDKMPNTAQIECIAHYRLVCLKRLMSSAFTEAKVPEHIMHTVELYAPWSINSKFSPAILFARESAVRRCRRFGVWLVPWEGRIQRVFTQVSVI